MARALVFNYQGEISELPLARLDRSRLHGSQQRVVCDEHGAPCSLAWLSADGRTLVPSGGISQCYLDDHGEPIEREALQTIDEHGEVLDKLPSTLGEEHELFGPVPVTRVLDHVCTAVYMLDAEAIGAALAQALDRGEIFEGEFRYTASTTTSPVFLLRNEHGTFGLVCRPVDIAFIQAEASDRSDDDEAEDDALDDELDFAF